MCACHCLGMLLADADADVSRPEDAAYFSAIQKAVRLVSLCPLCPMCASLLSLCAHHAGACYATVLWLLSIQAEKARKAAESGHMLPPDEV